MWDGVVANHVSACQVDANADNLISYEEFAPLCYEILVEVVSKELQSQDAQQVTHTQYAYTHACTPNMHTHMHSHSLFTEPDARRLLAKKLTDSF